MTDIETQRRVLTRQIENLEAVAAIIRGHRVLEDVLTEKRTALALLDGPAPGYVRISVPVLVLDADTWIAWEVDRTYRDDHGTQQRLHDPARWAKHLARTHPEYGRPFVLSGDFPVSEPQPIAGVVR